MQRIDVIAHCEDPGAGNLLIGLTDGFAAKGLRYAMILDGHARALPLSDDNSLGEDFDHLGPEEIFDATDPRLILVGTSENVRSRSLALIEAARRRHVPSAGVVDAPSNAAARFRGETGDPLAFAPDYLMTVDALTAQAFTEIGFPLERISICGSPQWDRVRERARDFAARDRAMTRRALFGAGADRRVVTFLAELSDGLDPAQYRRGPHYSLVGRGGEDTRTAVVLEEVLEAFSGVRDRVHFVLRLHPKNTLGEFAAYLEDVDTVSHSGDPLELVYFSDLVVGMTSSLVQEAALLGRPVLSVVPAESERNWLSALADGLIPVVWERRRLRALVDDWLSTGSLGEQQDIDAAFPPKCSERIVSAVVAILAPEAS